jgi:cyclopropane fatty-acyl-phospholipid synthase-like methyltransferase
VQKRKSTQKKRPKKPQLTAKNADKHTCYQLSVQAADVEVRFIDRIYRKLRGKAPLTLREDFCGTALVCAEWVRKKGRTAVGIDLDPDVLAWGIEHNLRPIGEPGDRVTLLQKNVQSSIRGPFDVTVGMNFSYFIFKTRAELLKYFKSARKSAAKDGLFIVDVYGGYEAMQPVEEPRNIQRRFTYIWDQHRVDPINNYVLNYIHFEFKDGSKLRKAFTYDWRMWMIPEIRELMAEAGFSKSTVHWEGADADGEGSGVFRPKDQVDNEAAWVAYIVAEV